MMEAIANREISKRKETIFETVWQRLWITTFESEL